MNIELISYGCLGGLLPDLLRFVKGRHNQQPEYYKYLTFWIGLILLVALGGFASHLAGATDIKQALAYGFAAPEIISRIMSDQEGATSGAVDRGGGNGFRLRQWWKR